MMHFCIADAVEFGLGYNDEYKSSTQKFISIILKVIHEMNNDPALYHMLLISFIGSTFI